MNNTRAKGGRTFRKAVRYAESFPNVVVIPMYQVSRFAQPQPFDAIIFRAGYWPRLVEVRSNQWRVGVSQTKRLSQLPGHGYYCQIWMFRDGETLEPQVRQWAETKWAYVEDPWEDSS